MIKRSAPIALLAIGLSVSAHVSGLSALWVQEEAQIEGGAETSVARLGDSFRDVALGALTPDAVAETVEETKPAPAEEPAPQKVEKPTVDTQAETPPPVAATPPAPAQKTVQQAQPQAVAPAPLIPTLPSVSPLQTLAATPPQAVEPQREVQETVTPPPLVLAALPVENDTAPILSPRPSKRPKAIEEAAAKRKPVAKPKTKTKPAKKPKKVQRGNGQTAERRGTRDGQQQAKAKAASSKPARKARAAGNAAASNYPGLVMRKIQRRKPRTNLRGTAVVSFSIASGGGLAALSLSKSSGSPKLDKLALAAVRRAAPFPPPPAGAKTRFSLPVRGR